MAQRGVNKATLLGNIGNTPLIRYTPQQQPVAIFQVATGEYWKEEGTGKPRERTDWHDIVVFNPTLAALVRDKAKQGMAIYLEGVMRKKQWKDDLGIDREKTEVIVDGFQGVIQLLSNKEV